ncbi:MAG TPA: type II secretion system F family protein [Bryobacteraceae bacterium]
MGLALFAFIAIFLLIASAGLLVFYRAAMMQRLSAAIAPAGGRESWWSWLKPKRAGESIKAVVQPFDKVLPKSPQEVSVAQKRLIRAGYREDAHVRLFYGTKVLLPLLFCILVPVSGVTRQLSPFYAYVLALGLGYLAPDFWLGRRIKQRQTSIRLGLPDCLDLMVVCIEAGLSLDQALSRTADEMQAAQPELSDEMRLVILEQRAGRPRLDAWRNFAERVDLEVVRTLVASIVQADQFGTSIAKTLRVYSDGLRTRRRQQVEELAAKTAVKLVFPLVFFIFPSLFVVALGPSILAILDSFEKYFK